ncbi:hypothetical protein GCM10025867_51030 (plasmid) [Frondihabitans sucicola]|uniref:Uncharacterized protein n=1 Tax=Frondihabitans sucicola TaxID=1268041 RepID=A0ABN6Y5K4_9MICO|nr:hypothetical protein [Frondihabitans sucicola]BDZ52296.1 hypothetical protein GCM10025867_45370 [Frondihabitans sucicola]BDZ52862.1 hypothetical protein GCM10025867_51030 [Frondihabitans sucicola]
MTFHLTEEEPGVKYEFDLPGDLPHLTQLQHGRRVKIKPQRLTISASRFSEPGVLDVYIEGPTVKTNGSDGQHRRGVAFHDNVRQWDEPASRMSELPAWAATHLARVREWESNRR